MSILTGLDTIIDRHLQVEDTGRSSPHHHHRTAAIRLSSGRPKGFDARQLLEEGYAQLVTNLAGAKRFAAHGPSNENWRFEKQLDISTRNQSRETKLERLIARESGPDWANQVPTASGLSNSTADKRAAIDLVWCRADRIFELIELKVDSDTPIRAAVEIIVHGLLYVLARENYPGAQPRGKALLQADEIHLRVLAPAPYYRAFDLRWLEQDLDDALPAFAAARCGKAVLASFRFEAFPEHFAEDSTPSEIIAALRQRLPSWRTSGV